MNNFKVVLLTLCGATDNSFALMDLINKHNPEVAVIDLSLNGESGLEVIHDVKRNYPNVNCLVLSMHDENVFAEPALRAGAKGYIMKGESSDELVHAIKKVAKKQVYFSDNIVQLIMHKSITVKDSNTSLVESLSAREFQVLQYIGNGGSTSEIAETMKLSTKTIECYKEKIKAKLNLKSSSELLKYAIKWVHSKEIVQA
jgi:DNA-binding NarL/FixJ family response regulator